MDILRRKEICILNNNILQKKSEEEKARDEQQKLMRLIINNALEEGYPFTRLAFSMGMGKTYTVARSMKEKHDKDESLRIFFFAPNISTRNGFREELISAGANEDEILEIKSDDDCMKENEGRLREVLNPIFAMKPKRGKAADMDKAKKRLDLKVEEYEGLRMKVRRNSEELNKIENGKNQANTGTAEWANDLREEKKRREKEKSDKGREVMKSAKEIIRMSKEGEKKMPEKTRKALGTLFPRLLIDRKPYILATHKMIDYPATVTGSNAFWQSFRKNDILVIDEADRIKDTMYDTQLEKKGYGFDCYEFLRTISDRLNRNYNEKTDTITFIKNFAGGGDAIFGNLRKNANRCLEYLNSGKTQIANRKFEEGGLNAQNIVMFGDRIKAVEWKLYAIRESDRLAITSRKEKEDDIGIEKMERMLIRSTRSALRDIRRLAMLLYGDKRKTDVTYTYEKAIKETLRNLGLQRGSEMEKAVADSTYQYARGRSEAHGITSDDGDPYRKGWVRTFISDENGGSTSSSFRTFMFTSTPNYRIRCAVESARLTVFVSATVMGRSEQNLDFDYLSEMFAKTETGKAEYVLPSAPDVKPLIDRNCTVEEINPKDYGKIDERRKLAKDKDKANALERAFSASGTADDKKDHGTFLVCLISFIDMMCRDDKKAGLFYIPAFPKDEDHFWNKALIDAVMSTYGNDIEYRIVKSEDLKTEGRTFRMKKDRLVVITTGKSSGVGENLTVRGKDGKERDFDAVFVNKDSYVEASIDWERSSPEEIMAACNKVLAQWHDISILEDKAKECLEYALSKISRPNGFRKKPTVSVFCIQQATNAAQKVGRMTRRVAKEGEPPVRKLVCYDARLRTEFHISKYMFPRTVFMGCVGAFFEFIEEKERESIPKEERKLIRAIERKNREQTASFMESLRMAREDMDPKEYDETREACLQLLIPDEPFARWKSDRLLFDVDGLTGLDFRQRNETYVLSRRHIGTPLVRSGKPAAVEALGIEALNSAYGAYAGIHLTDQKLLDARQMLLPKYVEVAKGEIGEAIFQKLCETRNIELAPLPKEKEEEADFVVKGTDVYIDVKNHRRRIQLSRHVPDKDLSGILVIANIYPQDYEEPAGTFLQGAEEGDTSDVFTPEKAIDGRNLKICAIHRFGVRQKGRTAKCISESLDILEKIIEKRRREKEEE